VAATGDYLAFFIQAQLDGATGGTIITDGILPFLDLFRRNDDGLSVCAAE
jgi:hypothetical protein